LKLLAQDLPQPVARSKGPRYTPVTKRGDKPDAIAWLIKTHPGLSDGQISRLIGTTKPTIAAVRDRTHWNAQNIKPRNPVLLGLCTQRELDEALSQMRRVPGAIEPASDHDGEHGHEHDHDGGHEGHDHDFGGHGDHDDEPLDEALHH
jgi:uncharacterized protein